MQLKNSSRILVQQVFEGLELLGFETRNKYEILDEKGNRLGFAAEQQKGILGFLFRQILGHWRHFEIYFFDINRKKLLVARHPFRFFFQCLELYTPEDKLIGSLEQRFAWFRKKFDVLNAQGKLLMEMSAPFWKIWTFPFIYQEKEKARVEKKWSGVLFESFTDKDKFLITYSDPNLGEEERQIVLAAAVFIDLQYFERKARQQ